jgi:hypothetical protein
MSMIKTQSQPVIFVMLIVAIVVIANSAIQWPASSRPTQNRTNPAVWAHVRVKTQSPSEVLPMEFIAH